MLCKISNMEPGEVSKYVEEAQVQWGHTSGSQLHIQHESCGSCASLLPASNLLTKKMHSHVGFHMDTVVAAAL